MLPALKLVFFLYLSASITFQVTTSQGLTGTSTVTCRFGSTYSTRATSVIERVLMLATPTLCAAACLESNTCIAYNVVTSSTTSQITCELLTDVTITAPDGTSTLYMLQNDNCAPPYNPWDVTLINVTFYLTGYKPVSEKKLKFNSSSVWENIGNILDIASSTLVVPQCGLYWSHMDVKTATTSAEANVSVIGTQNMDIVGVLKTGNTPNVNDNLAFDDLRWWPARAQLYLTSPTVPMQLWHYMGFEIASLMTPLVAFSVHNNRTLISPDTPLPFPFDRVTVNEGGAWDVTAYKFVVPQGKAGIYMFSFSTASTALTPAGFSLLVDGSAICNADIRDLHPGIDSTVRSVALNLGEGQQVWVTGNGTQAYGDLYQLVSFKGFLYKPRHGVYAFWSIRFKAVVESAIIIPFNAVDVLTGGVMWNRGIVTIKQPGTYYLTFSATSQNNSAGFTLSFNKSTSTVIFLPKTNNPSGVVTRSYSCMEKFSIDDVTYISVKSGTVDVNSSFVGFLLYPF